MAQLKLCGRPALKQWIDMEKEPIIDINWLEKVPREEREPVPDESEVPHPSDPES